MLILMPFVGWPILLQAAVYPPAGGSRIGSVLATWIGGTLVGVSVIFWINSVLSHNPARAGVDWSGHILVPYWPHLGIALGLFALSMLVSSGLVGTVARLCVVRSPSAPPSSVASCCSRSCMEPAAYFWVSRDRRRRPAKLISRPDRLVDWR
jgi:hypothetical protein